MASPSGLLRRLVASKQPMAACPLPEEHRDDVRFASGMLRNSRLG